MSEIPKRGDRCPVCGLPIDWVERRVVNGHVYYYAWHVIVNENGQKRRKKCYLGAERYDYVSRKHSDLGVALRGMAYSPAQRLAEYVNSATSKLSAQLEGGTLDLEEAREWLRAFRDVIAGLERFTATLEKYVRRLEAEEKAKEEAVNDTAPRPQAAETRQAEAYRALSTLVGLSPEDIERQLAKLREALKELKASEGGGA